MSVEYVYVEIESTPILIEEIASNPIIIEEIEGSTSPVYVEGESNPTVIEEIENPPLPQIVETNIGPRGLSAYQIAHKHGFEGTEEEWIRILKTRFEKEVIPLSGYSFDFPVSYKYYGVTVIDGDFEEVSVVITHSTDKISIQSLLPLENHFMLLTREE